MAEMSSEDGTKMFGLRGPSLILIIAVVPLLFFLLRRFVSQNFDPREPPVLQPRVPFIGHILSLVRESSGYFHRLHKARPTPICTLPMLNGKIYLVNSPSLIAAAMRNKDVSFDPLLVEFGVKLLGLTKHQAELSSGPGTAERVTQVMHSALTAASLSQMINSGMFEVKAFLNGVGPAADVKIPHIFLWLREMMSKATMRGLFGPKNPIYGSYLQDLWVFDDNFHLLLVGVSPNIIARKAVQARTSVQQRLGKWFEARDDQTTGVSALIRNRATIHREFGYTDQELGVSEFSMAWAAITNTNLSLMWLFTSIFSRPEYVERIRPEVESVTTFTDSATGRIAAIDITKLEKQCPVLNACYREALRLYNDNTGNRRVINDTLLQDTDGREYLLKKGTPVQWVAGISHLDKARWGDDVMEYNPERWLQATAQDEKRRRLAHIPFGGGKNLCPGRGFALAENMGFVAAVALGFEVEGVQVPQPLTPALGGAMRGADWTGLDAGLTIRRRLGWENVAWDFQ